jgi:hypothetical protein
MRTPTSVPPEVLRQTRDTLLYLSELFSDQPQWVAYYEAWRAMGKDLDMSSGEVLC